MFIQQIVCIEHQKGIVILISIILRNVVEGKIQCVSFAHLLRIAALIDHSAHLPCDLCGVVGAVIRNHKDVHQLTGIALLLNASNQIRQHHPFIARSNDHTKAVQNRRLLWGVVLFEQDNQDIYELIQVAYGQKYKYKQIDMPYVFFHLKNSPFLLQNSYFNHTIIEYTMNMKKNNDLLLNILHIPNISAFWKK